MAGCDPGHRTSQLLRRVNCRRRCRLVGKFTVFGRVGRMRLGVAMLPGCMLMRCCMMQIGSRDVMRRGLNMGCGGRVNAGGR